MLNGLDPLILDLDGTLLFAEFQPGALVIEGRRRNSYLARETISALQNLQSYFDLVLATGRSVTSVKMIANRLAGQGIRIKGMVAENGGAWIDKEGKVAYLVSTEWMEAVRAVQGMLSDGVFTEFSTCLALLKPSPLAIQQSTDWFRQQGLSYRVFPDGNKLFILSASTDKRNGLLKFLGANKLKQAVGVGNDLNDLEWLREVKLAAAPGCAHQEVLSSVIGLKGMVSAAKGHQGILEILGSINGEDGPLV